MNDNYLVFLFSLQYALLQQILLAKLSPMMTSPMIRVRIDEVGGLTPQFSCSFHCDPQPFTSCCVADADTPSSFLTIRTPPMMSMMQLGLWENDGIVKTETRFTKLETCYRNIVARYSILVWVFGCYWVSWFEQTRRRGVNASRSC